MNINRNEEIDNAIKTTSFILKTYQVCISYALLLTELEEDIGKYIDTYGYKPEILVLINKNKSLLNLDAKDRGFTGVVNFLKQWNIYKVKFI